MRRRGAPQPHQAHLFQHSSTAPRRPTRVSRRAHGGQTHLYSLHVPSGVGPVVSRSVTALHVGRTALDLSSDSQSMAKLAHRASQQPAVHTRACPSGRGLITKARKALQKAGTLVPRASRGACTRRTSQWGHGLPLGPSSSMERPQRAAQSGLDGCRRLTFITVRGDCHLAATNVLTRATRDLL